VTILYINHGLGTRCGVYSFGERHFARIATSNKYEFTYATCSSEQELWALYDQYLPDAVFYNFMHTVMPWLPSAQRLPVPSFWVAHLYDERTVSSWLDSHAHFFDYMVCLDPTLKTTDPRVFAQHRPIYPAKVDRIEITEPVRVGSFGFALPHKNFPRVMSEVNWAFESAEYRLHMTSGDFTGDYVEQIRQECASQITRPGVSLVHTNDYPSDLEMIERLSQNHLNALFYEFPPGDSGLSSAVDFLISAQRPMLLSNCELFRHVLKYVPAYPAVRMDHIVGNYDKYQEKAYDLYVQHVDGLLDDTERMLDVLL